MSEVIRVLMRGDGRTVYQRGPRLMVRFDADAGRPLYEQLGFTPSKTQMELWMAETQRGDVASGVTR